MFLTSPQVELKFPAPSKTGNYQYSVIMRSDSYLGLDQIKPLKVCVCVQPHDSPCCLCIVNIVFVYSQVL